MTLQSTESRPPSARPFEHARRILQRHLDERFAESGYAHTRGAVAPRVVALGATDSLRQPPDPRGRSRIANVHLTGEAVLVGPWGGGGQAGTRACGLCLAIRRQRLRPEFEREALEAAPGPPRAVRPWPDLPGHVVDAVWAVYGAVLLSPHRAGRGLLPADGQNSMDRELPQVSRVDLETLRIQSYPLVAEPSCPDCTAAVAGSPGRPADALRLSARPKLAPDKYRLHAAGLVPLPVQALANPVCGVLGSGTSADLTSPTTSPVTGSLLVRRHGGFHTVHWSGQASSFDSSRRLALLEGLERYAGLRRRRRAGVVVETYDNLGADALDPRQCATYPPQTYHHDPALTPFRTDRRIPWIWGYSLRDHRPILIPTQLVHYGAESDAAGLDHTPRFVFETSSGCATGSCLEEAILFGLLELIERDAFLLAWYGGAQLTEIDLGSYPGRSVRAMLNRADLLGYDVHAFDNRIDLAVPVVTGVAVRRDGGPGYLGFAAGASLDPNAAIESALSEVLTQLPQRRRELETRMAEVQAMARNFATVRQLSDHAVLFALPQMAQYAHRYLGPAAKRPVDDLYQDWRRRQPQSTDLLDDLDVCRRELVEAGFDVIVVDQTSPEQEQIGLRTVRAIVPGLIPIDFGWSRQRVLAMDRLRTAFRRAGWRLTDLTEAEVYRVPHPFP